jgi:hypothetical protein
MLHSVHNSRRSQNWQTVRWFGGLDRVRVLREMCCVVFDTAVPNTKLCAWGEEDSGGQCVCLLLQDLVQRTCACVFITAGPSTKLFTVL